MFPDIYRLDEVSARTLAKMDRVQDILTYHSFIFKLRLGASLAAFVACRSVSIVVIFVTCRECSSSRFRLSRVRWKDVERLLLLQYPVRCQRCQRRDYAGLRWALLRACKVR
jgi:hypothetical protein